jgi:uncharacterized integral membrane protein
MSIKNIAISVILAIIFTWFALVNSTTVTVSLIFRSYTLSLSLVILVSILIGVIIAGLVSATEETRMMGKIRGLEKLVKKEEKQVEEAKK